MIFAATVLPGVYVVELQKLEDDRGFFARSFCQREFEVQGLNSKSVQCNISFNKARGTLRGMHYQALPHREAKTVRCTQGAIYDVVVDIRPGSPTFRQWIAVELTSGNRRMLHIPEGLAHGFQTLTDNVEVFYQMSEFHAPEAACGFPYVDPAFAVDWPLPVSNISPRDLAWPPFEFVQPSTNEPK
jgi:dTDP-4-dehydrorhamnose 3,5-epimerase